MSSHPAYYSSCTLTKSQHTGGYTGYKSTITIGELEKLREKRAKIFDRWTWKTGKKEDREEYDKLDAHIKKIEETYEIVKLVSGRHGN